MKKRLTFLLTLILSLICVTTSGCSFLREPADYSDLPDSVLAAESVVIETLTSQTGGATERVEMKRVDAVAKVKRSSVAIYTTSGAGSGVIIDVTVDGAQTEASNYVYIITCYHVISSKGVVNVFIPDKEYSYENTNYIFGGVIGLSSEIPYYLGDSTRKMDCAVTLVGGDLESDIAVLRLDLNKRALSGEYLSTNDIVTAKIPPTTYQPQLGEDVFAVGNPAGTLPGTVSSGIISYLERDVSVSGVGTMRLMQIDVPTNPGSSGGGLYNFYGELIGITNAGLETKQGLNNAIPISVMVNGVDNGFVNIARQLIATNTSYNFGYVSGRREKLGFTVSATTESDTEIVFIAAVTSGSLAEAQGLKVNDKIKTLTINGIPNTITSFSQHTSLMSNLNLGDVLQMTVVRSERFNQYEITAEFTIKQFIFCDTGLTAPQE